MLPVLYSFRRCPYAMRARMALLYSSINLELREVLLKDKPPAMLAASPKGTVPVLQLPDSKVLDQSRDIMHWALAIDDPQQWLNEELLDSINQLIDYNDNQFKTHLDQYKYWERFPAESQNFYRAQGEIFLSLLEEHLCRQRYLLADSISMADIALFPFIRQFAFVDKDWFDQAPYPKLQIWLQEFLESPLFLAAMKKLPPWQEGDSPVALGW
jgi:glutathione S-transferase